MKFIEVMKHILFEKDLESKLILLKDIEWTDTYDPSTINFKLPNLPARNKKITFSSEQIKFPKSKSLHLDDKKAIALNSFANHELLAIEMMASAILLYPHKTEEELRFKKGVLSSLIDEQKHLKLYKNRMNELGYDFGDFPLNDFFWRQMDKLQTPSQYLAVMALTFEAANLDFALYYEKVFRSFDDERSANIMKAVYEDEISHVRLGVNYLTKWRNDKTLWEYYLNELPFPLSPSRAKGIHFDLESRRKAKMDEDFIQNLESFNESFSIVQRKTWK